jgi:hypothetical protein
MYRLVTFDGVTLPKASTEVEIGTATSRPALLAYRGGVIDADGTSRAVAELPYQLPMRCEVVGADLSTLRTELDALRAKRGVSGVLQREGINEIGTYQWATARLLQVPELRNVRNVYHHPLTLLFLVLTPWHGATIDDTTAISAETTTIDWPNDGQLPVTAVTLTITAPGGAAITEVTVAAAVDVRSSWTYSGTIAAGTALTINTATWAVENAGVPDSDNLHFNSAHRIPDLLEIMPGSSEFDVTLLGGYDGASVNAIYDELYE